MLEDTRLQAELAFWSLIILVIGALVGVLAAVVVPHEPIDIWWFVWLALISALTQPVHELVHAIAFLTTTGFRARIRFGFARGMFYTQAPGTVLKRGWFLSVLLSPVVVVTLSVWLACVVAGAPLLGYFCAVVHLAGCTGDFAYARIILSEPRANLIEDTPRGISLIRDE